MSDFIPQACVAALIAVDVGASLIENKFKNRKVHIAAVLKRVLTPEALSKIVSHPNGIVEGACQTMAESLATPGDLTRKEESCNMQIVRSAVAAGLELYAELWENRDEKKITNVICDKIELLKRRLGNSKTMAEDAFKQLIKKCGEGFGMDDQCWSKVENEIDEFVGITFDCATVKAKNLKSSPSAMEIEQLEKLHKEATAPAMDDKTSAPKRAFIKYVEKLYTKYDI